MYTELDIDQTRLDETERRFMVMSDRYSYTFFGRIIVLQVPENDCISDLSMKINKEHCMAVKIRVYANE
jgi:hypothetical protein